MPLRLLSSGSNAHGQLGHSENEDSNTFIPCNFLGYPEGTLPTGVVNVSQVATGANHTVVLLCFSPSNAQEKSYTEVWGCGDGRAGQLGEWYKNEVYTESNAPIRTDVFRKLEFPLKENDLEDCQCRLVAAGWETTYLVFSPRSSTVASGLNGDVVISMGRDDWGDLGIGSAKPQPDRTSTSADRLNVVSFADVLIHGSSLSSLGPLTVASISAGQHHVVVHLRVQSPDQTGCIVGWGAGRHGQISPPTGTVTSNAAPAKLPSVMHTPEMILMEDPDDPFVKCAVGSQHSVLLKASGDLLCLGSNRKGQLNVTGSSGTRAVDCTWNGTFIAAFDETGHAVSASGSNTHGQLGCGYSGSSAQSSATGGVQPVFPEALREAKLLKLACGTEHVLTLWEASDQHREMWGWGWNEHGNLGLGTTEDAHNPVHVPVPGQVQDAWAGSGTSWVLCNTAASVTYPE